MSDEDAEIERLRDSSRIKVAICDALMEINDDPHGPIVPPTAINWIGDALTKAVLALTEENDDE